MSFIKEFEENKQYLVESNIARHKFEYLGENGPIVAIHGWKGGWVKDGLRLFMSKNDVRGSLLYFGDFDKGIDAYLSDLKKEIDRYKNPTIVGFSAGGFTAIRYAQQFNAWDKIKKVVTIATPFNGLPKILGVSSKTAEDIVTGSSIIKETLNLNIPENKVVSIFAKEDVYIPHPEKIKLPWKIKITDAKSHGDVQNHQKWFEQELKESIKLPV